MRILITGGYGGVGATLGEHISKSGLNRVFLYDDMSRGGYQDMYFKFAAVKGDIRDTEKLIETLKEFKIDAIAHLAAITSLPVCEENQTECFSVNTLGTLSVLEAARKVGIKRIVFASTSAVYENTNKYILTEDAEVSPTLAYPLSKKLAEDICRTHEEKFELEIPILRYFNVFGPRQDIKRKSPPLINYIVRELKNGRSPVLHSTGEQKRDYVYVEDVCEITYRALTSGFVSGTYNVCSGNSISVNEIFKIIKNALKSDIEPVFRTPEKLWTGYDIALKPSLIARETNKFSLGSNQKTEDMFSFKIRSDLENLIASTAQDIVKLNF